MDANVAPLGIFWDIDNCPVPAGVDATIVPDMVMAALRANGHDGVVKAINAHGNLSSIPIATQRLLSAKGVSLISVPAGRKEAADKAILCEMLFYCMDATMHEREKKGGGASQLANTAVCLLTGDGDFAPMLHKLARRTFTVLLMTPPGRRVSESLTSAATATWDFGDVLKGHAEPYERNERNGGGGGGGASCPSPNAPRAVARETARRSMTFSDGDHFAEDDAASGERDTPRGDRRASSSFPERPRSLSDAKARGDVGVVVVGGPSRDHHHHHHHGGTKNKMITIPAWLAMDVVRLVLEQSRHHGETKQVTLGSALHHAVGGDRIEYESFGLRNLTHLLRTMERMRLVAVHVGTAETAMGGTTTTPFVSPGEHAPLMGTLADALEGVVGVGAENGGRARPRASVPVPALASALAAAHPDCLAFRSSPSASSWKSPRGSKSGGVESKTGFMPALKDALERQLVRVDGAPAGFKRSEKVNLKTCSVTIPTVYAVYPPQHEKEKEREREKVTPRPRPPSTTVFRSADAADADADEKTISRRATTNDNAPDRNENETQFEFEQSSRGGRGGEMRTVAAVAEYDDDDDGFDGVYGGIGGGGWRKLDVPSGGGGGGGGVSDSTRGGAFAQNPYYHRVGDPNRRRRQRSIDREDERIRARIGSSAEATTRGRVAEDGRDSELDSENARLTTSVATNHADRADQPPNAFTDMLESLMKELDGNPGARETDDDDDDDGDDDGGDERRRRGASNADASTFRSEIAEAPNETVTVDPNAPLLLHRAASPSESELSMRLSSSSSSSSSGVARDVATATANATRRRDSEKKPTADAAA